jgi:hypothetical protein
MTHMLRPRRREWLSTIAVVVVLTALPGTARALAPQVFITGAGQIADNGPGPKIAHFQVEVFFDYPMIVCQPSNPNCNAKTVNVCVDFKTVAGTATAGVDFVPRTGTLSNAVVFQEPGDTRFVGTIDVEIVADSLTEGDETFKVELSGAAQNCKNDASIESRDASATITDGEPPKPDLVVTSIALLSKCRIELTISNAGPGPLPDQAYDPTSGVALQMLRNRKPWGGIRLAGVDPAKKLKVPGATIKHIWFPNAQNLKLAKGSHNLNVTIDRFNAVAESNEQNNATSKRVLCVP